ncbi:MAG: DUF1015 domain-containing protein [Deltaproteobacteria bacterium]|nr:DUF1015 domain-containing protein [Deltaproteobacteria bacterium]
MVMIRPFRPLRYNPVLVPHLESVVAPPYDVISDAKRDALYDRNRYNVVRLILNRDADRYAAAAQVLATWREERLLVQESQPSLAYYVENFQLPDGSSYERSGILGAVRLESFSGGNIRPHEKTFPSHKADRMKLLRACRANLSAIFGMYPGRDTALDAARAVAARRKPDMDLTDDAGERHRVWLLSDARSIASITEALADAEVVIADGHHRYETALAYRDERCAAGETDPEAPHNFILMYLTSMNDPGLVILPTHRVLRGVAGVDATRIGELLRRHFRLQEFPRSESEAFLDALHAAPAHGSLGVALSTSDHLIVATILDPAVADRYASDLAPEVRGLDVAVLDTVVLRGLLNIDAVAEAQQGRLTYTHDDREALRELDAGADAVFFMKPPRMADLLAVSAAGGVMPQKSTYFFPKLLTGLVFHVLD